MSTVAPQCRTVTVYTFQGDRSAFGQRVRKALDEEKNGVGDGPSAVDCLLYTGHTGVSRGRDQTIYGFNPNTGRLPIWQAFDQLRNSDAFPGVVSDDTHIFVAAGRQGLTVLNIEVVLPDPRFRAFQRKLSAERRASQYTYGFPDGDGDCNCTTWLERLALPLLTGNMDEFTQLLGYRPIQQRRFGYCR